jgi:hypothetical protein
MPLDHDLDVGAGRSACILEARQPARGFVFGDVTLVRKSHSPAREDDMAGVRRGLTSASIQAKNASLLTRPRGATMPGGRRLCETGGVRRAFCDAAGGQSCLRDGRRKAHGQGRRFDAGRGALSRPRHRPATTRGPGFGRSPARLAARGAASPRFVPGFPVEGRKIILPKSEIEGPAKTGNHPCRCVTSPLSPTSTTGRPRLWTAC